MRAAPTPLPLPLPPPAAAAIADDEVDVMVTVAECIMLSSLTAVPLPPMPLMMASLVGDATDADVTFIPFRLFSLELEAAIWLFFSRSVITSPEFNQFSTFVDGNWVLFFALLLSMALLLELFAAAFAKLSSGGFNCFECRDFDDSGGGNKL